MAVVHDRMLTRPTTHPADASLGDARAFFADPKKHLMLLVSDGVLLGTVARTDLRPDLADATPALSVALLEGRTVRADADVEAWHRSLVDRGMRRLAVVDDGGRLLGLLCLKRHQRGFCSDDDVARRALAPVD